MGCSGVKTNTKFKNITITINDIKDIEDRPELLFEEFLSQEELYKLCNKKLKKLKKLDLRKNELINISILKDLKVEKLIILNLSYNQIKIINDNNNSSKYYDFPQLKELNLSYNNLINIDGLKSFKTPKLQILNLSYNQISIIIDNNNSSKYYDFPQLEELNLSNNQLTNIYELKSFNAPNLIKLDISYNHFKDNNLASNIEVFKFHFVDFPKLDIFDNYFYTEKYMENGNIENISKINNKNIGSQINNPIVSSYKLSSNE